MPVTMRTTGEIMAREKRDMLFVRFRLLSRRSAPPNPSRQRHLEWFGSRGLRYELAAPRGWLEGDPGLIVIYFDGPDDPRIGEYSAFFEDADGKSLAPDEYQMVLVSYASWLVGQDDQARDTSLL